MKTLSTSQKHAITEEIRAEASLHRELRRKGNPLGESRTYRLATLRNQLLITKEEQDVLSRKTVAFFGLSVGSHAAGTWTMLARPKRIRIADPDVVAATNLNRLRYAWQDIGKKKTDVLAVQLLAMQPFIRIGTLADGSIASMRTFCRATPRASAIVDEIDSIEGKLLLRAEAKRMRIPLISAVDVGDNVFLDIERYDTESPKIFLGRLPGIESMDLSSLSRPEKARLIIRLVGLEHNSDSMLRSLLGIGKTISTWPQLGSTASIAGGLVATTLKRIFLGEEIRSGRYVLDMDEFFSVGIRRDATARHEKLLREVKDRFAAS
jgi:hypothetical protein